jgi:RHS repeat-associated protein
MASGQAFAQYCPVPSTYFVGNYALSGCTVGSCWSGSAFPGSTAISGSQYPGTNYACATAAPAAGALENTLYTYDGNGNLTVSKDPLGRSTTNSYDALNRLTQVLDPAAGTTKYGHSGTGVLKQVTDPRNLVTAYTLNGFGETTTLASPDTGSATSIYDAAGNLLTRTDARGVTATHGYDGIHRVTQVVYTKSGSPSETHAFTYDVGANAKGRLSQVTDPAGTTSWSYEGHGRVTGKTQVAGGVSRTVGYAYNAAGQLQTVTTPSGQQIGYTYANNRVAGITVNGTTLIAGVTAEPFGPVNLWHWGNGLYSFRDYDTDGRLAAWEFRNGSSLLRSELTWDVASRITRIDDPAAAAIRGSYQYDALDRLTQAQKGNPVTSTQQFGYDAVGNRSSKTVDGQVTNYTYSSGSNRLTALTGVGAKSYTYDPAGNPTAIGTTTFVYNLANRLTSAAGATYTVNALGQRLSKTVGTTTTLFAYDEQGHLLGEYDGSGTLIQETVWLEDLPVATLRPTGSGNPPPIAIYYVHPDHLGSPRAVTRPSDNQLMWRWDNTDSFGANLPNENPAGQGSFTYALRFPGQYYDAETQTHYNYFRDYDPAVGRYLQSDPIGLRAGTNTYSYANASPVITIDADGLLPSVVPIFNAGVRGATCQQPPCEPSVPEMTKPCFRQYPTEGDPNCCLKCCAYKGTKWCSNAFSRDCQWWGRWGRNACVASCTSGSEPTPPPPGLGTPPWIP